MSILLGDTAPNFQSDSQKGKINLHEYIAGSWVFFFSHPGDFTPVCTTEMGRTAQLSAEFEKRNVKPLGLSTDSVKDHQTWINHINETQETKLEFPILADTDRKIATLYGMIYPGQSETAAVRSVFIIDPKKKVRLTMTYPMSVGCNFDEILRVIDALQTADEHGVATPADWKKGDKIIIPLSVTTDEAREKFLKVEEVKSYLRYAAVRL